MTQAASSWVVAPELDPLILPAIGRAAARLAHGDEALAEDLEQEGRIAAWRAAATWRPNGGVGLRPWAMTAARYAMCDELRRRFGLLGLLLEELPEDWELGDAGASAETLERAIELRQRLGALRPREWAAAEEVLAGQRLRERRAALRLKAAVKRIAG